MNGESANKFISALVKSLQTLCQGYVEFNDGIEIIGHLYLNIDSGSSFDYIVKEKVCKGAENSTVFVSKSYAAQSPPGELVTRKDKGHPASDFEDSISPLGTSRLQSAITSISNVLSGTQNQKPRLLSLDQTTHSPAKRKREHNGNYSSMQPPYKYANLQSSSSSSAYFNNSSKPVDRNHTEHFSSTSHAEFFGGGGDSNQSSGMGPDDEDDLDLDVTFVKAEYSEGQRYSSQRGVSAAAASRLSQDPASSQSAGLHEQSNLSGQLYGSTSNVGQHQQAPQQFTSGTASDLPGIGQAFQDTGQLDMAQHGMSGPPNPRSREEEQSALSSPSFPAPRGPAKFFRCPVCSIIIRHKNNIKRHMRRHNASATAVGEPVLLSTPTPHASHQDIQEALSLSLNDPARVSSVVVSKDHPFVHTVRQTKWAVNKAKDDATAGPPTRMPEGVKPLCGYVHQDDAEKWMMLELVPGSGVYIHQENFNVAMSKTRQERPDGKAMARYLMSCFWRQSELVGASIAEPPKPHQKSLDRGIVHAILGFCQHHSRELPTDIRRTIQQKIGYAKFYFVKKTQDPGSPKTTPASISVDASPRRMSMEMARRAAGGPLFPDTMARGYGKKGRRSALMLARGMSEPEDVLSRLSPARATPEPSTGSREYSDIEGSDRLGDRNYGSRGNTTSPAEISSDRLPQDLQQRSLGDLASRVSGDLARCTTSEVSARLGDFSGRMSADVANRLPSTSQMGRLPEDLSSRGSNEIPQTTASDVSSRLPPEFSGRIPGVETSSVRETESSMGEQTNRMSSLPSGMSRGFLDMLNNIYPNN